jgi:hypothetical protein
MTRIHFFTVICTSLFLVGCAAPYQPYVSESASKVRLKLANGAVFSSVAGNVRSADDGKCGEPMRVPQLFPYFGPSMRDNSRSGRDYVPTYLRASMQDSTDPTRGSEAELQLAPGRHLFSFFAGIGLSNCGLGALIDMEPKRQYEIAFRFDTEARQCLVTATRLEESQGRLAWQPYALSNAVACKK